MSPEVLELKNLIENSDNIVFFGGAGVSTESNIPDFRSENGIYNAVNQYGYPPETMLSHSFFISHPEIFFDYLRKTLIYPDAKPNNAHIGLAKLEEMGKLKAVVTQNIDNLHERAGSTHVIHLHGELTKVTSSWQPNNPKYIRELKPEEFEVKIGDKAGDGSQLRPFIVWFGEAVPMIETAIDYAEQADIFVIIGTSLNVYPAAGLLNYVPRNVPVYLIDPKEVPLPSGRSVHVIQKGASEGMAELKKMLLE